MKFWRKIQGWKLPLLGLFGLSFALISVLGRAETPPKEPVTIPPAAPYENSIAGIGIVEPRSELIAIGTELPGIVRAVHVKVGEKVKKGAALFSLDQRDIDAQIATLEASLSSAKIQAEDAALQFKLVNDVIDKRSVSKDDYNRRKYAAQLSKTRIAEIEAQLNQAQTTKDRLTVIAPIDGTILDINIRSGEFATSGVVSEPLIRMGDLSELYVRVEFDEENAALLSKDAPAEAYARGVTAKTNPLKFVRFEPYVTPKQNLAVAGQRVDTRVLQVIYALPQGVDLFTGQQMDVFVKEHNGHR
jgi:HlyD family secretion protein